MSKTRSAVDIDIDTFGGLITKVNQVLSDQSNIIVTTDFDGSSGLTQGNAHIDGNVSANTFHTNILAGGNNSVSGTLTVSSNITFNNSQTTISSANTFIDGDVNIFNITKNISANVLSISLTSAANTTITTPNLLTNTVNTTLGSDILNLTSVNSNITSTANTIISSNNTAISSNTTVITSNAISINGPATFTNTIVGSIDGNANTSNKWATARTFTFGGDLTGSANVDGSANITLNIAVNDNSHNHAIANITNLQTELDSKLTATSKAADSTLLNGVSSSLFVRTDTPTQKSSKFQLMGPNAVTFGNSSEMELFYDDSIGVGFVRTLGNGIYIRRAVDSINVHRFFTNGDYVASGEVSAHSDERLKSNIKTITNALEKTKQLRGVSYTKDDKDSIGVIAQEIAKVVPEVVQGNEEDYYSVSYGNIVALLIEAIKELEIKVQELSQKT